MPLGKFEFNGDPGLEIYSETIPFVNEGVSNNNAAEGVRELHLLTITLDFGTDPSYLFLGEGIAKKKLTSPGWSFGRELGSGVQRGIG